MNRKARAFSLLEVMVAVVLVALTAGPLINLLSFSNKTSSASAYELIAAQNAAEIAEQLQRLSGTTLKEIAQLQKPSADLGFALRSLNMPQAKLMSSQMVNLENTNIGIFLSALDPHFENREITASILDNSKPNTLALHEGKVWAVNILYEWKLNPSDPVKKNITYGFILRENS